MLHGSRTVSFFFCTFTMNCSRINLIAQGGQIFFGLRGLPDFQGGFDVSTVLPTSSTQTFIKKLFLIYGCDSVPINISILCKGACHYLLTQPFILIGPET